MYSSTHDSIILTSPAYQGEPHTPGCVVLRHDAGAGTPTWRWFEHPRHIVQAARLDEVMDALRRVEAAVATGLTAAGFVAYEAAPAFDPVLRTHPSGPLPLLWFGLYDTVRESPVLPDAPAGTFAVSAWTPSVSPDEYRQAIARIKAYIAAGDTYQVNYTMRLRADFAGDAWSFFRALCRAQQARYCAYLNLGNHVIGSASPELFFRLAGTDITCKPMKGTAPRGLTAEEDRQRAEALHACVKNRAENLMIVDMTRNDLGRIARTGSVHVPRLFDVEQYDTLFQMTSTVAAHTDVPVTELLRALAPCASITGAPKVRTMQIISELETAPRGIYTGCIGYLAPGRQAQFNVAIRTVHIDCAQQRAEYGVGGGIVWDSTDDGEYAECRTKALVLTAERPAFELLETLLWRPGEGYFLLEHHLERLAASARYFGFRLDLAGVCETLQAAAAGFPACRQRVRLLAAEDGQVTLQAVPLTGPPRRRWRVALSATPVDRHDRFLYHKTTHRAVYESARAAFPGHDDVLLWNSDGQVTESTIANLVVRHGGELITPAVPCGLLAGTYRAHLLQSGRIREGVITLAELRAADAVYLINSVRGWVRAAIDWAATPPSVAPCDPGTPTPV